MNQEQEKIHQEQSAPFKPLAEQPFALLKGKLLFIDEGVAQLTVSTLEPLRNNASESFVQGARSDKGQQVRKELMPDWTTTDPQRHLQKIVRIGEIVQAVQERSLPKLSAMKDVISEELQRRQTIRSQEEANITQKLQELEQAFGLSASAYRGRLEEHILSYFGPEEEISVGETRGKSERLLKVEEERKNKLGPRLDGLEYLMTEAHFDEKGVMRISEERRLELVGSPKNPGELSILLGQMQKGMFTGKYPSPSQTYTSLRTLPALLLEDTQKEEYILEREKAVWDSVRGYTSLEDVSARVELERRIDVLFGKEPNTQVVPDSPTPSDEGGNGEDDKEELDKGNDTLPTAPKNWLSRHESPWSREQVGDWLKTLQRKRGNHENLSRIEDATLTFFERFQQAAKGIERSKGNPLFVYQDKDLLVIDKPVGVISHYTKTLPVGALEIARYVLGPDIALAHRLDRETSGILVFVRNPDAFLVMKEQFGNKETSQMQKVYAALVDGEFSNTHSQRATVANGRLQYVVPLIEQGDTMRVVEPDEPMYRRARRSVTYLEPIAHFDTKHNDDKATLLKVQIVTGMTHQIRVVLSNLGLPIKGDKVYNPHEAVPRPKRMMLHAWKLTFRHPSTGKEMTLEAKPGKDFIDAFATSGLIKA